jgi:Rrf2 family nitric oxide-sensitive transcriptional repressor
LTLAVNPRRINLGKLIKQLEPNFDLVECFDQGTNRCCIAAACGLKGILTQAKKAFVNSLKTYSLADVIKTNAC